MQRRPVVSTQSVDSHTRQRNTRLSTNTLISCVDSLPPVAAFACARAHSGLSHPFPSLRNFPCVPYRCGRHTGVHHSSRLRGSQSRYTGTGCRAQGTATSPARSKGCCYRYTSCNNTLPKIACKCKSVAPAFLPATATARASTRLPTCTGACCTFLLSASVVALAIAASLPRA